MSWWRPAGWLVLVVLVVVGASVSFGGWDDPPPGFDGELDCRQVPGPGAEHSLWWRVCAERVGEHVQP